MAVALVTHVAAGSSTGTGVTTAGIDTTGANFIALLAASASGLANNVLDSKSNTWTALTKTGTNASVQIFYVFSPTVGTGHTFTNQHPLLTSLYPTICVASFSGVASFDVQNGAESGASATSLQPGSITPAANGALLVSGLSLTSVSATPTINLSFTVLDFVNLVASQHYGGALAYLIQGTAAATNPTWGFDINQAEANIASFLATGAGGRGLFRIPSMSGVGIGGSFFGDPLQARHKRIAA